MKSQNEKSPLPGGQACGSSLLDGLTALGARLCLDAAPRALRARCARPPAGSREQTFVHRLV